VVGRVSNEQAADGSLAELPSLVDQISVGTIALKANAKALADVDRIWAGADEPSERTVLVL
jgi:hypothetical protein